MLFCDGIKKNMHAAIYKKKSRSLSVHVSRYAYVCCHDKGMLLIIIFWREAIVVEAGVRICTYLDTVFGYIYTYMVGCDRCLKGAEANKFL